MIADCQRTGARGRVIIDIGGKGDERTGYGRGGLQGEGIGGEKFRSGGAGEDFAVDGGEVTGVGGPGVEAGAGEAGGAADVPGGGGLLTLGEKGEGGLGPGGDVTDGPVDGGRACNLTEDGDVARKEWDAAGEGLGDGEAEAFRLARLEDQAGTAVDGREYGTVAGGAGREERENDQGVGDLEVASLAVQVGGKGSADLDQTGAGDLSADRGEDGQEDVNPLAGDV
jgi:hypothetical protein